ncbi:MAG TPA: endonuclease MutS2 [Eubacteriaceae bacterium]|nr:endonuclease MutS2 [Eubacteriaceae bacterium]
MDKNLIILEYNKIIKILSEYTTSSMGKEKILSIRPMSNIVKIQESLSETSEAVSVILAKGKLPLNGLCDIGPFIRKAKIGSILSPIELLKIAQVLKICQDLKKYIKEESEVDNPYQIINDKINQLNQFPGLMKEIFNVIVNETEIADNASPQLSKIRKQIRQKNSAIREKLNKMVNSTYYQKYLQDTIVTIREGRFVIPVKQEYRKNVPGLVHDQSTSKSTLFIEPIAIVDMNNDLKSLLNDEKQEIERILSEFTNIIGNNHSKIKNNLEILTNLDIIFAKGYYSIDINGIEPSLNKKGIIILKKARHPLIPKDKVVPSDIYLGKDFNSLLITGPNTGGKTITLKTIGLLCLMAQSGLHISAGDGSEIGVFDKILADIGDEQSIEQSLSTFSSHMINIVNILQEVNENSLVLFDELGAGTDPTEGVALAISILDYLHKRNIKTVATTHYRELKEYALSTDGIENASVEFDVETLKPTYVLLVGIPGKSNAFEISKRLGLSEEIINSAKNYISKESIQFEDVLLDIENKRKQIEVDEIKARNYRLEAKKIKEELEREKAKLDNKKDLILLKSRKEALKIIKEAKNQSDMIIKELKEMKNNVLVNHNKDIEDKRKLLKEYENTLENKLYKSTISNDSFITPKILKPGDRVYITTLNQKGYVLSPPNDKEEVEIQAGVMKILVHISNIKLVQDSNNNEDKSKKYIRNIKRKSLNISPEIDLRGLTVEDAIINIDKYLDDAYIANLNFLTIIHGKGTGILRKNIHEFLKNHSYVKEYRLGSLNEGGDGVTIVTMK